MRITLVEPFYTGSHAAWAREYAASSRHQVELLTLPGRNWKWRMHGGAVSLASRFLASPETPDLILATDMLDLATFLALTRQKSAGCRCAIYFHENQLTYPWSPTDPDPHKQRDLHYAFINYTSALAADAVLFNSAYHRESFLSALPGFLKRFPDEVEPGTIARIAEKSCVLPLGVDLRALDRHRPAASTRNEAPLILWNHRWEFDKCPEEFFQTLYLLAEQGLDFRLAVLGESFGRAPSVFGEARQRLSERVVQWGYLESFAQYAEWLWRADLLPVTSHQEFFGASVVQALYCGCTALLPDRLAYPEHVPAQSSSAVIYRQEESFAERLASLLRQWPAGREPLRDFVSLYDWSALAPRYDELLEEIAAGDGRMASLGGLAGKLEK
jgi:glycosyltransferase involved in cell wall biosynthesis